MAIIDAKLMLSEDQAFTTVAAHDSSNVIDFGAKTDEWDAAGVQGYGGDGLYLTVVCTATVTSDGAATIDIQLEDSADNSTFADAGCGTGATAKASFTQGYVALQVPLPSGLRRYAKVTYTVATAALTAGAFTAYISTKPQRRSF